MPLLYDQFGREIKKEKAPSRRPLAAAPITDAWRDYVSAGLTPRGLATVLQEADGGDVRRQAELFDQIEEKDGHIQAERSKRVNAILDMDFAVTPASEDARDVKVAEFVDEFFSGMTDWEETIVSLQDAVGKGFAGLEIQWDLSSGQALPEALDFVEQKRFLFVDEKNLLSAVPRLVTDDVPMGIEIPPWKMMLHRYGGKSGHPTRSGILRTCAWMYLFKNYAIKDWVIFLEVFGMPLRLGKYEPGASDADKSALITAIASLGSDAAGIISKNTEIEFIEAIKGRMAGSPYKEMSEFCNRENSKAILGQTLTAEVGDAGSYAASKTHNEVRLDLLKADGRAIAATIRHQLIRPIVGFNFGWDTPVPGYTSTFEEDEDFKAKAEWVGKLLEQGVRMPAAFVRQEFKIPEPEDGEEMVGGLPLPVTAKRVVAKAPAPLADAADVISARLETESAPLVEAMIARIRELVMSAGSLEEIRDHIIDLYPAIDSDELGLVMARAMATSELAGRNDAENGN
ncbi:MAG: DUF935 domain-containing protein [Pseudomonadota bacterium]